MALKSSYRTAEVASMLGFSERQIRRKCEDGTIPAVRLGGGEGRYLISGEWVKGMLAALGKPIPGQTGHGGQSGQKCG